jgi:hypothetical protein
MSGIIDDRPSGVGLIGWFLVRISFTLLIILGLLFLLDILGVLKWQ